MVKRRGESNMRITAIIAFIVVIGILVLGMELEGSTAIFINLPGFIFVVGGTIASTITSFSFSETNSAIRAVCKKGSDASEEEYNRAILIFSAMRGRALAFGIIGFIIGCILILAAVDDLAQIGPSAAVALLTILYGICLSELVFAPLVAVARKKLL